LCLLAFFTAGQMRLAPVRLPAVGLRYGADDTRATAPPGQRSGPLGFAGLLFTPSAMIVAQVILTTPIVISLVHRRRHCCGPNIPIS
jgi:hypothetical protein